MWPTPHKQKTNNAPAKTRKVCMAVTACEEEFIRKSARAKGVSISDHLRQNLSGEVLSVQEQQPSGNGS